MKNKDYCVELSEETIMYLDSQPDDFDANKFFEDFIIEKLADESFFEKRIIYHKEEIKKLKRQLVSFKLREELERQVD